jgi:N-acetylneuraminic acid mutarotase
MKKIIPLASANQLAAARWARQGTYVAALLMASFSAQAQRSATDKPAPGTTRKSNRNIAVSPVATPQAVVVNSWATVAPLSTARLLHASVAVGNNIYVWGGYNNGSFFPALSSLEIYNSLTNTWQSGAPVPLAMGEQAFAVGNDGLVYSFGGYDTDPIFNSYRYNPTTNTWTALAAIPNTAVEAGAATGNDGKIYVLGGIATETSNQIYNPTTNTWTTGAAMPTGRSEEVVVKDAAGLLHAIGGSNSSQNSLTTHEVYNPATNTWTTAAPLPQALTQAGGTLGSDGNLYVIGGQTNFFANQAPFYNTVYVYSPSTNTWTQGSNLPMNLGGPKGVTIGNSVYSVAGTNGSPQNVVYRTDLVAPCNNSANTPVAGTDSFTASCGPITVTAAQLLANDTSPNATPLAIGSVSGGANGTVVNNGDGTFTFTPFPGYTGPASFTYLLQAAGPVFPAPATGHYYEFVAAPGICWDAARTAAASRSYAGLTGYLATLNTAADVNAVKGRAGFGGQYWFGAADDVSEGTFMWKTGPEAGQTLTYANWSPGEPDDYKNQWRPGGEDYAMVYGQSGLWNDLDRCGTAAQVQGYVVEYGGLEACLPVLYSTGTVNVNVTNTGTGTPSIVANPDSFSDQNGAAGITTAQLLANDTDVQGRALSVVSVSNGSNGATAVYRGNGIYTFAPGTGNGPWTFNYLVQLAGPVFPSTVTGHYYEFVATPNLTWTQARAAAASRTYNGLQGYLATITSAAETDLLKGRNPDNIWFGAADDLVEGEWRWKTGPEAGQLFYQGNGTTGGATVAGRYSNWSANEPNDFKNQFRPSGEDYAHMYGNSGQWNDLSDNAGGSATSGYFVEYGGLEACTPVLYATGTVSIYITHHSSRATADAGKAGASVLEASPNPSNGQFSVRVVAGVEGQTQLDLFDLNGRRISGLFSGSLQAGEQRVVPVNVSDVASGLYMVRLQSGKDVKIVRIAIQK